jgi:hypothetical protein
LAGIANRHEMIRDALRRSVVALFGLVAKPPDKSPIY